MRTVKTIWPLRITIFILGLMLSVTLSAQKKEVKEEPPVTVEEQLESLTEMNEDEPPEDDEWLQDMIYFSEHPVNLNSADPQSLQQLKLITPIQIHNLIQYRKVFGPLLHIYELQAVPGWDLMTIRKMLPYITVQERGKTFSSLQSRFAGGEHTLLVRSAQILERSRGYLLDASEAKNYYKGSPQKLLLRYKYKFKNNLQFGLTAEKDAGEQFFRGAQKAGFDFYSVHFFAKDVGVIQTLAVGDFTVNMGQGLIHWQGLSFTGGVEIMNIKRQSEVLRPHSSAGEIAFHRGAGVTVKQGGWSITGFGSYRRVDAGTEKDSLGEIVSVGSLRASGLHRTQSEIDGRNSQEQLVFGANVKYEKPGLQIGANAVVYKFGHPLERDNVLYNKYVFEGIELSNYSVDWGYTYKNMHVFGEAATDMNVNKALVTGLVVSATSRVDMSFLYRNISPRYQSLYSSSFTANSRPQNERGFYSGISILVSDAVKIAGYADVFSFPWLKYRTDAPSEGANYMLQLNYRPARHVEIYSRFRSGNKPINDNWEEAVTNPVLDKRKLGWRTQFSYMLNTAFTLNSRVELTHYDHRGQQPENGFLIYAGLQYKPGLKPYSANMRLSYFETDGYNSRIYAFENDVLYGYSVPVFYDKGYRYYMNVKYRISKGFNLWIRFAQTIYDKKSEIGSGLDQIKGNKKSEVKVQVIYGK